MKHLLIHSIRSVQKHIVNKDKRRNQPRSTKSGTVDKSIIACILLLTLFGIIMVYDSSVSIAIRDFDDQYHFAREQLRWLSIGLVVMFIFSYIDYHWWYKAALPLLIASLILLVAVFIPGFGVSALGAHRWLNFGFFIMQPAEFTKLSLVIYLSAWLSTKEKGRLLAFIFLLSMVFGLIILEPDLGTSIIIVCISMFIYFISGARLLHFALLVPAGVLGAVVLAITSPYRFRRVLTFLNPEGDPLGASYHIRQVLLGLGSGGLLGLGIGQSRQKFEYLPEANTDSIFAIIGEETGFVGSTILITLYVFLVWRCFLVARFAPDTFGKLLASGIASWIGIQTIINLSAMVSLIPLTGVPLPFISYGGSSMVILLSSIGILLNISRQRVKPL